MVNRDHQHGAGSFADLARDAKRVADRFTWLRLFVFAAMFVQLSRAYVLTGDIDSATYIALWVAAMIGCWTASGWLLDVGARNRSGVCSPSERFPAHALCHWRMTPYSN